VRKVYNRPPVHRQHRNGKHDCSAGDRMQADIRGTTRLSPGHLALAIGTADLILINISMEGRTLALKLTTMGTSTGVVIPREMLTRLKVSKGDTLFAVETPSGYILTPYDPDIEKQLALGREFMGEYRDTLRALAK
jgi:putative addiction module antidote